MRLRFLSAFLLLRHGALADATPEVRLGRSTLRGSVIPQLKQEFFGGIPFAEPAIGENRFAPPVGKFSLDVSTFDATGFGNPCPQASVNGTEDCLTINVLRPSGLASNNPLPVMAWVYGGSFLQGSASDFNGSSLVAHSMARGTPIIYVNFNYRVGALGFPQGSEAQSRGALNLGLKDVLMALKWINLNIRAFGGDKDKVTVYGQSAGSIALSQLFLSPSLESLVRAAIFQSGSAASNFLFDATRREANWKGFVSHIPECSSSIAGDTFDCLRAANLSTILNATQYAIDTAPEMFPFVPVVDGPGGVIPDLPSKLFSQGHFAHIPFISGNVKDEGTVFIPSSFNTTQQLQQWMYANTTPSSVPAEEHESVVQRLLELYPDVPALGSPFDTGNETFAMNPQFKRASAYIGDFAFQTTRRMWMQAASEQNVTTFGYLFSDPQPNNPPSLGVSHATDIPYVYGELTNPTPSAHQLSNNMMDYWISFATSLDPNDAYGNVSRTRWVQYSPDKKRILELIGGKTRMIADSFRANQMGFMNSVPLSLRH